MVARTAKSWTYVIVGAGTAGCVLANRLSEDRDARVLLLEAGGGDYSPYIRIPAGFMKIGPKHNWLYPAEPDESLGGHVRNWSAGRVIGGSSSINVQVWTRGHPNDYDYWAANGCPGWDYASLLPCFVRGETFVGGADDFRGGSGPQHVSFPRVSHPLIETFIAASQEAGYAFNPDYNGAHQEGVGYGQFSQRRGFRDSTATSYLRQARRRPNLRLEKHALATRLLFEGDRAVGVEYVQGGQTKTARPEGELILAAGAFGSPKLLMLAGIGPAEALRAAGVEVRHDLPGVGQNLQDHPVTGLVHSVNCHTLNMDLNPLGVAKHALDFVVRGRGAATASGAQAIAYTSPATPGERPDFEFIFRPFSVNVTARGIEIPKAPAVQSSVWHCHPASRGAVSLRTALASDPLRIDYSVIGDPHDVAKLTEGVRMLRDIFAQAAFRPFAATETDPGADIQSDEDWAGVLHRAAHRGNHPTGTCKMGSDPLAVVDPELRVRGVEGLRVVDASVMPALITGHTNAPTAVIAERASEFIRGTASTS